MMTVVCKLDTANKECRLPAGGDVCTYARSRIKSITRQRGELSRRGAPRHLSRSDRAGFDFVLTLSAYRRCENLFDASRGLEKLLITQADATLK